MAKKVLQLVTATSTFPFVASAITTVSELEERLKSTKLILASSQAIELTERQTSRTERALVWKVRSGYKAKGANIDDVSRIIGGVVGVRPDTVHTGTYKLEEN